MMGNPSTHSSPLWGEDGRRPGEGACRELSKNPQPARSVLSWDAHEVGCGEQHLSHSTPHPRFADLLPTGEKDTWQTSVTQ